MFDVTFKKDRSVAGERTDSHRVLVDGAFMGVIGRETDSFASDYTFTTNVKIKAGKLKLPGNRTIEASVLKELKQSSLEAIKQALRSSLTECSKVVKKKQDFDRAKPTDPNRLLNCPTA